MLLNLQTRMWKELGLTTSQQNLDGFWRMIYKRHLIWYKRFVLKDPPPWTKDPIFLEYKFTNMYRELDRGTLYLLDNIVNTGNAPEEEVFNIILYRMFNRVATYDHIGFQTVYRNSVGPMVWPSFVAVFNKLRAYAEAGNALYTDAHMVCAYEHFPGRDKLERFEWIFAHVLKALPKLMTLVEHQTSLGPIHKFLTTIPGIGPFNAYEIVVDISYATWNNLHEDEWVNPGPGCMRGLKDIFPDIKPKQCQKAIQIIRECQKDEFARLKLPFSSIAYKDRELTLRNVEHDLCEYHKYFKALHGLGRPRNKFKVFTQPNTKEFHRLRG